MSRLIDADELKKAFIGNRYGTKAIEYVINDVPTVDAVPVIRCKDCKYWAKPYGWNGFCDKHGIPAEADDFCSWARRKEE